MRKMFVADDEYLVLSGIKVMLKKLNAGYEVVGSASDGVSAVREILNTMPDVVMIDIRMPGLSGLEVIGKVRDLLPDTLFVLMSGYKEFEYAQQGIELGVIDYIEKPLSREKLQKLVNKLDGIFDKNGKIGAARIGDEEELNRRLKACKEKLATKIAESDANDWREPVDSLLAFMKQRGLSLDQYKQNCYQIAASCAEVFYDRWRLVEKEFAYPHIHVLDQISSREEADSYIILYLERLFEKISVRSSGNHRIEIAKVISYLNDNYMHDISLENTAEMIGMTGAYLSILFHDATDMTFTRYLTKIRMDHAKDLLRKGYKVGEVSDMVGYSNYRYFSSVFRKEFNMTPQEFKGSGQIQDK